MTQKFRSFLRSELALEMAINAVLPYVVYSLAEPSLGKVYALMASAIPPIIWSVIQIVRQRRLDALSMIVLAGIALSLLAFLGGGGYRMLQLREHLVPAVTALVFIGSVAIRRPLIIVIVRAAAKRKSPDAAAKFERQLGHPGVRRLLAAMTLAVGGFLLLQVAIAVILIFALPIKEFLIVSPIIGYGMAGLLVGGILLFKPRIQAAFRAANAQAPAGNAPSV